MALTVFARGADLALGDDLTACGHGGEEVDLGAVWSAGAADGLAVDGQRTEGLPVPGPCRIVLAVGEPAADRGVEGVAVDALQETAHGGLGRGDRPGRLAHGAIERGEYGRRRVGGPFRDRSQGLRAREHGTCRQCQEEDQGMTTAGRPTRVGHGSQALQQAGMLAGGWR
ncbi:hypothetical protein GCM10010341_17830 [Streptomyces noursei]|nr:hypothetical protein GCM10010341_17830 [Streptomyces noursei]